MNTANVRKFDTSATLACIGALLCWSVGPIFIKLLTGHLDVWTQNLLRYSAACLFWGPFLLFALKKKRFDNRIWRRAFWPAVANIAMQSFWAGAFYYVDPAFMVLLTKSSIIWIAGFSLIFFADERPLVKSARFWLGLVFCVVGVIGVIVCKEDFAVNKTVAGTALALVAAFGWAIYTIAARIAFKDVDSRSAFSVTTIYTVAGLFVLAVVFGQVSECIKMGLLPWVYIVVSGLIAIAFSHVFYYVAMKRLGATIPSLVLLSVPFTVLAISGVVFGESLNGPQWLFGVILLAGSALAIWAQRDLK